LLRRFAPRNDENGAQALRKIENRRQAFGAKRKNGGQKWSLVVGSGQALREIEIKGVWAR
jgi:hypothetical protein